MWLGRTAPPVPGLGGGASAERGFKLPTQSASVLRAGPKQLPAQSTSVPQGAPVKPVGLKLLLILAVALLITVALAGCGGFGGSDRLVVYVSETDGNPDVYTIDVESGENERIVSGPDPAFAPTWSPEGERVAYVVSTDGNRDVVVAGTGDDGFELRMSPGPQVETDGPAGNEGSPRWNSDGDRLAYISEVDGQSDVFVARFGEDDPEQFLTTRITSADSREMLGDWSPDGQWLVFSREGGEDVQGLWLRNPDGVNLLRLTDGVDSDPVWSPDGDAIAFVRDDFGNYDIYLLRPEEDEDWRGEVVEERWLKSDKEEHSPAWAPDGDTLVFVTTRDGNAEIYTANANDDEAPQRLTINDSADTEPVWSPDGDMIAFVSDLFGETEIMVMDSDGTNQRRLTHNDVRDHSPDW